LAGNRADLLRADERELILSVPDDGRATADGRPFVGRAPAAPSPAEADFSDAAPAFPRAEARRADVDPPLLEFEAAERRPPMLAVIDSRDPEIPDAVTADSETPDSETPTPEKADPETAGSETSDSETPGTETGTADGCAGSTGDGEADEADEAAEVPIVAAPSEGSASREARRAVAVTVVWSRVDRSSAAVRGPAEPFVAFAMTYARLP
jgi:hypothetical protein